MDDFLCDIQIDELIPDWYEDYLKMNDIDAKVEKNASAGTASTADGS